MNPIQRFACFSGPSSNKHEPAALYCVFSLSKNKIRSALGYYVDTQPLLAYYMKILMSTKSSIPISLHDSRRNLKRLHLEKSR
jgi:hypothetical protein